MDYVKKLTEAGSRFTEENVAIITPFKLQESKFKDELEKMNKTQIAVGTVQTFQGQEKEVIILSTVRSRLLDHNGRVHIGFLGNKKVSLRR